MKMEEQFGNSSLFDLKENVAAALVFVVPAVVALLPGLKYVMWAIPLAVLICEKQSLLVRVCAGISLVSALFVTAFTLLILLAGGGLTVYHSGNLLQSLTAHDWGASLQVLLSMAVWLVCWLIGLVVRLIYLGVMIFAAVEGFRGAIVRIPLATKWGKKLANYSD